MREGQRSFGIHPFWQPDPSLITTVTPSQEYKLETAFYQESKAKSRSNARDTVRMVGTREKITSEILISLYFEAFTSLWLKLQQVEVQKHTSTLQRLHSFAIKQRCSSRIDYGYIIQELLMGQAVCSSDEPLSSVFSPTCLFSLLFIRKKKYILVSRTHSVLKLTHS